MKTFKNKKGFTLVELIIVITILAILGTIAFVSYQGYTKNARNSARVSTMKEIEKGLQLYEIKTGVFPGVDTPTQIWYSGSTNIIGYQGYFGSEQANMINMNSTVLDPLDGSKYLYMTNANYKKYQLLAFMEPNNEIGMIGEVYTGDYINREPEVYGTHLGILLNKNTKEPISGTGIELKGYTGAELISYVSNDFPISGTGEVLEQLVNTIKTGGSKFPDPNCDLYDISIGDQTWAGCNSTLGNGVEYSVDQNCYNYLGGSSTGCNRPSNEKENLYNATYGINNIWGKLYTWANSASACPAGRHVPSDKEWATLEQTLYGSSCRTANSRGCAGLGWSGNVLKNNTNNIVKALKIPLAGYRNSGGGLSFSNRGHNIYLWSSSEIGTTAYDWQIDWNFDLVSRNLHDKAYGFSVRCIKD